MGLRFLAPGARLIGATSLSTDQGLVLVPCRAIHTWFMRFALDIIFFSRDGRVVRMAAQVKPFRMVWGGWPAWGVMEMQSGWFPWSHLNEGDQLVFKSKAEINVEHGALKNASGGNAEKTAFFTPPIQ